MNCINKRIIISFYLFSILFICNAKLIRNEINLGEYIVFINVPDDFCMFESPFEEGKFIHFFSPTGSSIFLFTGGGVIFPLVNRENAGISSIKNKRDSYSEYGTRDSVFFRETVFLNSKIRVGYDNVRYVDIAKFEKIIKSIKIKKRKLN